MPEPEQMTDAEVLDAAVKYVKTTQRNLRTMLHVLKALEARLEKHTSE